MFLRSPEERVNAAHDAFELWYLLDGSRSIEVPDECLRLLLEMAFMAGLFHGLAEAKEDLVDLEQRLREMA